MTNNNNWDYEAEMADMFKLFDPDNMTQWRKYSREEFLGMMIMEIKKQNILIRGYSELLAKIPEFRSQTFRIDNQDIAAIFFTDVALRASRMIDRLLETTGAYDEETPKTGN